MKKFKHKQTGIIAEQITSNLYRENHQQREIPKIIIENSNDREEIKDKKYLKNGIYIGEGKISGIKYIMPVSFNNEKKADKRNQKFRAYKKIMSRIEEMNGDREPGWEEHNDKYYLIFNMQDKFFDYLGGKYLRLNDFICKEKFEIPEEIKQAVKIYFTS